MSLKEYKGVIDCVDALHLCSSQMLANFMGNVKLPCSYPQQS
jgi:hypothetical protein